jgi:hypothetical protein
MAQAFRLVRFANQLVPLARDMIVENTVAFSLILTLYQLERLRPKS